MSPRPLPKGITWDEKHQRFQLRIQRGGVLVVAEYFSVREHGSKTVALREASAYATAQRRKLSGGEAVTAGRVTVGDLAERYLASKVHLEAATRRQYETQLTHLGPLLRLSAASLTVQDVSALRARLEEELGATTVRHVLCRLRETLALAVRQQLLRTNVAADITLPKRPKTARPYSPSEVRKLLQATDEPWLRLVIRLISDCALRPGEICALRWTDVIVDGDIISVCRSRGRLVADGTPKRPGPRVATKTDAGTRLVPTTEAVRTALDTWRRICPNKRWVFPALSDPDKVMCVQVLDKRWKDLLAKAEVEQRRAYDLRHTSITNAVGLVARLPGGMRNIADVATWAGHADPTTTVRMYTHLTGGTETMKGVMDGAYETAPLWRVYSAKPAIVA